jgi:hypothetical protein
MSQRRMAQFGLVAAAAVLVTSLGMLVSNGGDTSQMPAAAAQQSVGSSSHKTQAQPLMTLSASTDSSTTVAVQR